MVHDFAQKLAFSNGRNMVSDIDRIMLALHSCGRVEKTDIDTDKAGIDYYAHLSSGVIVNVDAKARERGASRYWKWGEPELAIETWSVITTAAKKVGWTYNVHSAVDYILYTFDSEDSDSFYFLPFQLLRKAAVQEYTHWAQKYFRKTQHSWGEGRRWDSECIFVPASVVISAITEQMKQKVGA